jgi:hypothetical protein
MSQVVSQKNDFSCGLGKKDKIQCLNKGLHENNFFVFFNIALKMLIYRETLSNAHKISKFMRDFFSEFIFLNMFFE